jgi:hypothetical protein
MPSKSFYDLDYIIEVNEKRIEQYLAAYQKVLDKFTNIILIYSAITIFLISIIQDIFIADSRPLFLYICFGVFSILFLISLYFSIRLIIPVKVAYLDAPNKYYEEYRFNYEQIIQQQDQVEHLLKTSYLYELETTLNINRSVFSRKSSFYNNAIIFALLSAIPYLICLGFHISKKEENVQKDKIINMKKFNNLQKTEIMPKDKNKTDNSNNSKSSSNKTKRVTNYPGVDNNLVIPSYPIIIKENSSKIWAYNEEHVGLIKSIAQFFRRLFS